MNCLRKTTNNTEKRMEPDFWHERWEQQQIGFHQSEINAHLQAFWPKLDLPKQGRIFVPLCGKSRDLLWLRSQGYEVIGVEISRIAVRDFFQENALVCETKRQGAFERWETDGLVLLCGDFFDLTAEDLDGVVGIYDRASLVALPPAMRPDYARHLTDILPTGVPSLLVSMEYDAAAMQGPPFCVHEDEVRELFAGSGAIDLLFDVDLIDENPQFRKKGLDSLVEKVYRLRGS